MDNNNFENTQLDIQQGTQPEKPTIRDTFYGRIDVSVQTMDKVILGLFSLLVVAIVLAVIL